MSIYNLQTLLDDLTIPRARRFNKRLMVWTWRGSNFHERLRVLLVSHSTLKEPLMEFGSSAASNKRGVFDSPSQLDFLTIMAVRGSMESHGFEVEFEMISAKPYTQTLRILYVFFLGLSKRFPGYVHKLGQLQVTQVIQSMLLHGQWRS